jgi:transcriptional regulator with XRE-family HTH domain
MGEKLRLARKQAEMSLRDLADRAEVSASMLSQIENGKAVPSVRSLYSIAAALSLPVDHFFPTEADEAGAAGERTPGPTRAMTASEMREAQLTGVAERSFGDVSPGGPSPVVHQDARPTIQLMRDVMWSRLTASAEAGVEFLEITYAPGATSGINMSHHQGREFGLVLDGELVVELGFERYTLRAGDSIIFDSTTPHRLTNSCNKAMRAIWVVLDRN